MECIQDLLYSLICKVEENNKKRKIWFDDNIYYYYIPTMDEINEENLKKELWWSFDEMDKFRSTATNEITQFAIIYPHFDTRFIAKKLWTIFDFDEIYKNMENEKKKENKLCKKL